MSSMMGGEAGSQEDMFAKLDAMRSVITEVNTQFKDPVSSINNNRRVTNLNFYYRKQPLLSACAYLNFCLFTKPNGLCKN
jgi:hypothetical protein